MADLFERITNLSPAKRELLRLRLESGKRATEPVAIIGSGCRFPGAKNPEEFWQLLRDGRDAISEVPADRWDVDTFYDPDPATPGKMNTRWGGFLEGVDQFDAGFFAISPREAARMDPQQRLLLEVAWEALEDAGQTIDGLAGSQTGVFVGVTANDHALLTLRDAAGTDSSASTGTAHSIVAGRLSYLLDLRGPSMAVDTACSSSLVAVHLACQGLLNQECNLALAGGVNLMLSPLPTICLSKVGMMAPDGRCKTFDAHADGYVRGEGCGVVVLKRLSDALSDGDNILALIQGSAVNQDGHSTGLTAPNVLSQQAVIRQALENAGVTPSQVSCVEAHGTGTSLGDPIEVEALTEVYGQPRAEGQFCALGSVKTNIGHLEAAAGVAGLIKAVLSLQHEIIPPHLNLKGLNPHISLENTPFVIPTEERPWPSDSERRYHGLSSFGFSGTNAHVVLAEAPQISVSHPHEEVPASGRAYLLPLSARTPEALRAHAQAVQNSLAAAGSSVSLQDMCYSASARRSHHDHRLALVGHSHEEFTDGLGAFLQGEVRPGTYSAHKDPGRQHKLVFVFSGQGAQRAGMGRELLEQEPVFRETVEKCDELLHKYASWSLLEELSADEDRSRLDETEIAQPATFALQVALAALWRSWEIEPDAVVGHSLGELAAAHVAGVFPLEDAMRIVFHRGRLMQRATGQGKMAAVGLSSVEAERVLAGYEGRLSIAAINSPTSTVLSGEPAALEEVLQALRQREVFCRELDVNYAFHSSQMDPLQTELVQALQELEPRPASLPIISTVTGRSAEGRDLRAAYWGRQLREPVLFAAALGGLLEEDYNVFLELSPQSVLSGTISQCLRDRDQEGVVLSSLRRGEGERAALLGSLGALYTLGCPVGWPKLHPAGGRCVRLPSYAWQRERCWLETTEMDLGSSWERASRVRGGAQTHPLLGQYVALADSSEKHVWDIELDRRSPPYLEDHRVQGATVLPGTAYVEMALAAANEVFGAGPHILTEMEFQRALFFPDSGTRRVQVILSESPAGEASFHMYSRLEGPEGAGLPHESWTLHATGSICRDQASGASPVLEQAAAEEIQDRCPEEISSEDYYSRLQERGLQYGPCFQGIEQLWRSDGEALGQLQVPHMLDPESGVYQLHPALLDAGLQVLGAALPVEAADGGDRSLYLPIRIEQVRAYGCPGLQLWSHARLRSEAELGANTLLGDIRLLDEDGGMVAELLGVCLQRLEAGVTIQNDIDDWLYEFQWEPKARSEQRQTLELPRPASSGSWLIFADSGGVGEALASLLKERGERCVLISPSEVYQCLDGEGFRIRPERPEDIRELLEKALGADQPVLRGVVHLWSLDALPPEETTVDSLEIAQTLGCVSVLHLVQALARTGWTEYPRLWLVTQGAQPVGRESEVAVGQSPVWGLGRVVALEHPELRCVRVNLDPAGGPAEIQTLFEELWSEEREDQIALRGKERFVLRLVRHPKAMAPLADGETPPSSDPARTVRSDGTYLITGGLGGLGLQAAQWLVGQGARHLVLMGRRGASEAENEALDAMRAAGAQVAVAQADVAEEEQVARVLDEIDHSMPSLRGVIHAAGILDDGILLQLDRERFDSVMAPKVKGAWNLHSLSLGDALDFFVLFSSAASLLGSPGQGNYSAANAFLDALAHYRRARGLPALSINWGPWAEVGLAARHHMDEQLALRGIESIRPEQGVEALGRLLCQEAAQMGVIPLNPWQWSQLYPEVAEWPLLSHLVREEADIRLPVDRSRRAGGLTYDALFAAEPEERRRLLEPYLQEQVAAVLGISASKLNMQQPLGDLGLNSLMAVELQNQIKADLRVFVSMADLSENPSIAQIATQILEGFLRTAPTPRALLVSSDDWEEFGL
jgi:myxalamid-type polyketide synthase MxaE and MxaD